MIAQLKMYSSKLNFSRTIKLIWSISPLLSTLSLVFIGVENAFFLLSAYIFKHLIDFISHSSIKNPLDVQTFTRYILSTFAGALCYVFAKSTSSHIAELQGSKVNEYVDDKIHASAVSLDLAFYESPEYFDTLKRAKDAGTDRPVAIVTGLVDLVKSAVMFVTLSYILFSITWMLLPLLVIFSVPAFVVRINLAKKLNHRRLLQTPFERQASYFSSLITGDASAKEIRSFGLGEYLKTMYLNIRLNLLSQRIVLLRKGFLNGFITDAIATTGFFACVAYICYRAVTGAVSVGDITLFLIVFPQLFGVIQGVVSGIAKLYQDNVYLTQLFYFFDLKPTLIETIAAIPVTTDGAPVLETENLHFTYPHSIIPALRNINLIIPAGKLIAVVGLNGAGKTTLIKMLCRLYDPTEGCVKLNGTDIRKFNSADYRKCISTVFQDFNKYNVSVADNIRFGDIDSTRSNADIITAAGNSGADSFIDKFPNRYDTIMGRIFENGHEVSIGQWQKLAIARALYSPSKFIILDEATSALDAIAEYQFFNTFRQNIGNRGALIISHRVSAVKHADYIYVMSHGEISQAGTHLELIAMDGDYANLFKDKVDA